uniref:Signal peptidase I n=1 Tax=uncultured Armatimonadetes bacterium TaxID=157466 RepID=A0A6J4I3I5_9BACT|nr:Signal peptidase I [uncultured Armatimonadetes bacterium]
MKKAWRDARRCAKKVYGSLGREALVIGLLSVLVFGVLTRFVGQSFQVDGRCMEPRLYTGERVLGEKMTFRRRPPRRGDVIVFIHPQQPSELYIKRIVALGGQTVAIRSGRVYVDERPLAEPYVVHASNENWGPHRVIDGRYFVLGDNRPDSDDSRVWGDVDGRNVVARACLRYWPPDRWAAPF